MSEQRQMTKEEAQRQLVKARVTLADYRLQVRKLENTPDVVDLEVAKQTAVLQNSVADLEAQKANAIATLPQAKEKVAAMEKAIADLEAVVKS